MTPGEIVTHVRASYSEAIFGPPTREGPVDRYSAAGARIACDAIARLLQERSGEHGDRCDTCVCGRPAPVQDQRGHAAGVPDMPEGSISWEEHVEVWTRYAATYGSQQSAERMAERGGFGFYEAQGLLGRPLKTWSARGRERRGGGW